MLSEPDYEQGKVIVVFPVLVEVTGPLDGINHI
jgi:hypothetical protein